MTKDDDEFTTKRSTLLHTALCSVTLCSCPDSTPLNANSSPPNAAVYFAPRSTTRRCMHRRSIAQKGGHFLFQRVSMLQPTSAIPIQIPNGEDRRSHRGQDGQRNEPHRRSGRQRTRCFLDHYNNAVRACSTRPPTSWLIWSDMKILGLAYHRPILRDRSQRLHGGLQRRRCAQRPSLSDYFNSSSHHAGVSNFWGYLPTPANYSTSARPWPSFID